MLIEWTDRIKKSGWPTRTASSEWKVHDCDTNIRFDILWFKGNIKYGSMATLAAISDNEIFEIPMWDSHKPNNSSMTLSGEQYKAQVKHVLSPPVYSNRVILINSLGSGGAILRWRSWSTLVQVMACCLTAPSHYLNQCWLIVRKVL